MKTLIRNFSYTFRRFFAASVLNIAGLSIAFSSFFVIMTQIDYDYNFNKGYKDYKKIFRVEVYSDNEWTEIAPRPILELISSSSPHILSSSIITYTVSNQDFNINGHIFNEKVQKGFGNFLETFQPQMLCGSTSNLNFPNMVLIPESMAIRFYGQIDVIGKSVTTENTTYTIGGVYKDFPKNSEFENNNTSVNFYRKIKS